MADPAQNIEANQVGIARLGLKQVITGLGWLAGAYAIGLVGPYVPALPFAARGWLPLIARLVAEAVLIGGLLKVADGPDRWKVRELAIFGGLATLLRPLFWALRTGLFMVHVEWELSGLLSGLVVLVDAGAFAAIAYVLVRIQTESGGDAHPTLAVGVYVSAGVMGATTVLERFVNVSRGVPLTALAGLALAVTLFLLARQCQASLPR